MTQSENDSFSSVEGDNDCPRDFLPVNESLDYVYAMLHESQRRVPFYGWSTSRFIGDPPNFYMQLVPEYPVAARSTFQAQFVTENRGEDVAHGGCIAIAPLEAVLPNDYGWAAEEWEVGTRHPHGTDEGGWRYASSFDDRFRASDRPSCEVRRRLWRRRVRRLSQRGPCGPSPTSANPPAEMDDVALNADYLRVLTKEMRLAEGLKSRRRAVLASGADWNSEFDTDAEEELRTMTKEHQTQLHQASANRGRVSQRKAYAFESPTEEVAPHFFAGDEGPKEELHFSFHPQSSVVEEEQNLRASFLGANGRDSSNTLQRNTNIAHHLPADISRNASVTFRRHSNSEQDDSQHSVPLDQVPTIERFVSDSGARELSAGPVTDEPLVMLSGEAEGEDDFDAIFKKFVSSKP